MFSASRTNCCVTRSSTALSEATVTAASFALCQRSWYSTSAIEKFDRARSREVAREVTQFNEILVAQERPYLLVGVGRWGSLDPWNLIQWIAPYLFARRVVGQNTHELS